MNELKTGRVSHFEEPRISLRSYAIGFASCITLTVVAFVVAATDAISDMQAIAIIGVLAVIQCWVQLRRFLHLGDELKPRWRFIAFATMLVIVFILVAGSLWIMSNLDYRMIHDPEQMYEYIEGQDGL